jgi:hypothetical protein
MTIRKRAWLLTCHGIIIGVSDWTLEAPSKSLNGSTE